MSKIRNITTEYYHHVYSRGVNKKEIFLDHSDYLKFQELIKNFNTNQKVRLSMPRPERDTKKLVNIFCYTLMPNHFHFVLKGLIEGGVSLFLQKVLGQYSNYFNKKYKRVGPLFESRFKNKLIDSDQYFEYLVGYIWNNPIKLINSKYKSIDLFYEKIKLNEKEKEFALNYPYKYFPKNYFGPEHKKINKINFENFDF